MRNKQQPRLFKYVTEVRFLEITSKLEVYFASNIILNDVYEGVPQFKSLVSSRRNLVPDAAYHSNPNVYPWYADGMSIEEFRKKFYESDLGIRNTIFTQKTAWRLLQRLFRRAGIFCLSGNNDSPIMWGMYADNGRGICIEFNPNSSFIVESQLGQLKGLHRVRYKSRPPRDIFINTATRYLRRIFLTKGRSWQYESEFRCFRQLNADQKGCSVKISAQDILSITLGPNSTQSTLLNVFHFIEKHPHVKPYHAIPSPNSYQLSIQEIFDLRYGIAIFKEYFEKEIPFDLNSEGSLSD